MREDKKQRLKMLYELEALTDKESHTEQENVLIERYRKELGVEKQNNDPMFKMDKYLEAVKNMPKATDSQRAKVMGITKNQLCCGKRRHKLIGISVDELLKMA